MNKRSIVLLLLLAVVAFYALGTGFSFFYRFLYVLLLLLPMGFFWAWLSLRGINVQLSRSASRGQVGGFLEGQISLTNLTRLPKSWLEVVEITDLPDSSQGRGAALGIRQRRSWQSETYLSLRGRYRTGQVEVTSQDPFGLFRLGRRFLQPQDFTVLPAAEALPDLDPTFVNLPNDGRIMRHWDNITTDVAAVRHYNHGDSFRRIHWPYTARMNSLMVKEFDIGLAAETWIVLDMESGIQVGTDLDRVNNTEELSVTVAASLINRLVDLSVPVGLAANSDSAWIFRPNSSPEHQGRLMEALAVVRASGATSLARFLYDLRPSLSRYSTLTVITPSPHPEWVTALDNLRRGGVKTGVVMIDHQGFGEAPSIDPVIESLFGYQIPSYVVKRGQPLNDALRSSLTRHVSVGATAAASFHRAAAP